mgnify:CR=1 FL=1
MRGIPRTAAHNHCKIKGSNVTADMVANPSSICGWNPDMYGVRDTEAGQAYYDSLMELYASWGVDFIKCDDICNTNIYPANPYSARHEIEMLAKAIARCGRPIVLSLSPGPALIEHAWHYETYANMWRITDDFWDKWDLLKDMFHRCELWQNHVSKGCYPDCDMLPLGWLGKGFGHEWYTNFTPDEQHTMLTLWCLFGSPLMLGCELTKLDDATLALLTNRDILSMLTPDCKPHQICLDDEKAIWCAHNAVTGEHFIAFFNLSDETQTIHCDIETLRVGDELCIHENASLTELWSKEKNIRIRQCDLCHPASTRMSGISCRKLVGKITPPASRHASGFLPGSPTHNKELRSASHLSASGVPRSKVHHCSPSGIPADGSIHFLLIHLPCKVLSPL